MTHNETCRLTALTQRLEARLEAAAQRSVVWREGVLSMDPEAKGEQRAYGEAVAELRAFLREYGSHHPAAVTAGVLPGNGVST